MILESLTKVWMLSGALNVTVGNLVMYLVGICLIFLGIKLEMEPLLLLPIGLGAILANIPLGGIANPEEIGGVLGIFVKYLIRFEIVPTLIFMGIGAMTDFGPLLADPKTFLLGAAAQVGIFLALFGAILLGFSPKEAASIGIIGGADGPTTIYVTTILAPHLLGATSVAAYSYMALVPIIQPPVIKALTTKKERMIRMKQLRVVPKREKILFPIVVIIVAGMLVPKSIPLIGMLMAGNLFKESGVTERLANVSRESLMNIVTVILGLSVGSTMSAVKFLRTDTLLIMLLGVFAFATATAGGVLLAKLMNLFTKEKINPMIGAAGVSAVPMAARVVHRLGKLEDPYNNLLMHAMGPNIAGVLGSATAAGVLIALIK
ncbi:MAG: sodium ion-translocating decarboxylase subunit beta [Spirochaetota bacterium]|nr:MAG: sodium ion-translocating decarboxylase subunit beta [Spirochaetota bacterium]